MKRVLHLIFFLSFFGVCAQQGFYRMSFEDFSESRGNAENGLLAELPYAETIIQFNPLNNPSGLGPVFNFHGNIVIVEQMNVLPDGAVQIIIRREDGKDFFGRIPTLKAILIPLTEKE